MDLDEMVKYLIWVALFIILLGAIYFTFKKFGIL